MEPLDTSNNEYLDCNICFETLCDNSELIRLKCCNNSKTICIRCIHCLTTLICPYCRKPLEDDCVLSYMNDESLISRSEPIHIVSTYTWERFLEDEHIINPFLYDDSRRLRRHIRRLRYEYQQMTTYRNINTNAHSRQFRRQSRRRNRHGLNQFTRDMTQLYNDNREEEMFLFEMDT